MPLCVTEGPVADVLRHSGLASEAHVAATFGARDEISHDTPTAPSRRKVNNTTTETPATTGAAPPVTSIPSRHGRQSPYVEAITCENTKDRESRLKYIKAQMTAQAGTSACSQMNRVSLIINIHQGRWASSGGVIIFFLGKIWSRSLGRVA